MSDDKLTWTFKLRDGLRWHDGQPVTSADVIPSIKRFTDKDVQGGLLAKVTREMTAVDERGFRIVLKEPFGLMLKTLAKSASVPLFVMPKRVAELPITQQLSDTTGSGPFIFKKDEWKPGENVVYVRNPDYKPRAEPPSGLSGAKIAKLDRIEWISIPDTQTAINALLSGEIDMIEAPAHDLLPVLEKDKNVELVTSDTLGSTYVLRFNWKQPPFDDVKVRRAAEFALNQPDFLKAAIGDPRYYKECRAMFGCGAPLQNAAGMDGILLSNFEESKRLLKEAGYDGKPIVLMQTTDIAVLANLAPVAKNLLEKGGFKVDMQSMDWQTVVTRRTKKDPADKGGWSAFHTYAIAADILNPISAQWMVADPAKAWFGWPSDPELEKMRDAYARETDPVKGKALALAVQNRMLETAQYGWLGIWYGPGASRANVTGWLKAPVVVHWNIEKK